ncbi:conserved hypothetical protein [Verticillium alfalfae VaMs.102]|uniref:Uncharacterized protein n=1 Tax=Verticillium alfalfae (strain VaMs.102 / ATCC MYA-4576 / FGSC 10136) TaxID=526221 RepID=C9SJZ1_VERA1|nr:conserved hypothetical protein [Verticillium alfalfae VaMs.102]EEY19009.1 conserved hypothetical protein [Verticillium alfalfae VaMs.102]
MSYDYEPRERMRHYTREETRIERGDPRAYADESYLKPHSSRDLVPRRREDSDLSVEDIRRDFPPPGYRDARRTRSAEPGYYDDYRDDRSRRGDYYGDRRTRTGASVYGEEEEVRSRKRVLNQQEKIIAAVAGAALAFGGKELYDRRDAKEHGGDVERNYLTSAALGAAGALAGYQGAEFYNKQSSKNDKSPQGQLVAHRGRDGLVHETYVEEDDKKGSKSFLENALAASGLGAAVKALTGGSSDNKDDNRSRGRGSPDRASRSGSKSGGGNESQVAKVQKAAMASLIAGATEAFRVAKEPGGWKGEKTKRIFTAAAGAAAVDAAQDREKGSKLGLAESVIGGLVGNRVINGSKGNIEADEKTGRSRSRSRARSRSGNDQGSSGKIGRKAAGAAPTRSTAATTIDPARVAAVGVSSIRRGRSLPNSESAMGPDDRDGDRDSRRDDSLQDDRNSRRGPRRYSDDPYDDDYDRGYPPPHGSRDYRDHPRDPRDARDPYDDDRSYASSRRRDRSRRRSRSSASGSDLGDSDDDLKTSRRMRANGVYQSMAAREARQKAVKEGRLSPEEAKKLKAKAMLQDAAQIGLAGLGIKGAMSQLKTAKDKQAECKDWEHQRELRHQKRLERQGRSLDSRGRSRADDWYTPVSRKGTVGLSVQSWPR